MKRVTGGQKGAAVSAKRELRGFTEAERDAIYAGLRLLGEALHENRVKPNDGNVGDILTAMGGHAALNADQVHELCDELLW